MASEYLDREAAAKKQLGKKGVKKRVKQLPTAARAFTKEMTGVDISRKGVSVDPLSLAMALPLGKVVKAARVLRAAGNIKKAAALESRLKAKSAGKYLAESLSPKREPGTGINSFFYGYGKADRAASRSVFPRRSGAQSGEFLGMNSREITANLARKTGRAAGLSIEDIRAFSKATADSTTGFTKFSKKLKKRGGR